MLIGVHDELIGQCKEVYAEKCADRLCEIMKNCVKDIVTVPFKCDPSVVHRWYEDEMSYGLQEKYNDMLKDGISAVEAKAKLQAVNSEFLPEELEALLTFEG